jgi:hypothetical protein
MSDGHEDLRRVGRDEMNLAEFPIAVLTETRPQGTSMLQFKGTNGTLTVIGSEAYGLPTAVDADVIIGLLQLTKVRTDFIDRRVGFTRHELLRLLGWPDRGRYYQRLEESLDRWTTVTLKYDNIWWNNKTKHRVSACFHILSNVVISERPGRRRGQTERQQGLPLSYFTWDEIFFESCQAGNLKCLDLDTYFSLKSAVSKQLYRFLDKRFYLRRDWTFDLRELAFEHVGLSRNYTAAKLKEKLRPALEELEAIGFLEPMSAADRYSKTGRGAWNIRLVRKLPPPAKAKLAEAGSEPTGLERELVERGVTRSVAADLVRDFPADRIRRQVEVVDWLRETKPKRVADVGAYLAEAIRKDFAPPAGFRSQAERAEAEATARARQERDEQARRAKARAREAEARIQAFLAALTPERRAALEAEALAGADPADRAVYAAAPAPVRRLLLVGLRDALVRHRLGLPDSA